MMGTVVGFLVILLGLILFVLATVDEESWDRTEDPDCYMRTHHVNSLFGEDSTTIERYCKESS